MDYLKILQEDCSLAADFDALFDFFLLDEPTERDEVEGRCTFSLDGKAFARDGAGGEYHQLEDGSIGYVSSEGQCGRIAESIDDLSICWYIAFAGMIIVTPASIQTWVLSKPMPMSVMMKSLLIQKWKYGKRLSRR